MERHFDTQIVVRNPIESILVPKTSENPSNRDLADKSTEMTRIIAVQTAKNVTKIRKNFFECPKSVALLSGNPFQDYLTSLGIKSMFYDLNYLRMTNFAV